MTLCGCTSPPANVQNDSALPPITPKETKTATPLPVEFLTIKDKALRIVYICDRDPTFLGSFDAIRIACRESLRSLQPEQSFSLVFSGDVGNPAPDATPYIASHEELVPACPKSLEEAVMFLDRRAGPTWIQDDAHPKEKKGQGFRTDPIPAIRKAFSLHPDVMFMLTNGDYPNNQQVLELIRQLNKEKRVRINTIAYIWHGEHYEQVLQTIAKESSGTFKFISTEEIP